MSGPALWIGDPVRGRNLHTGDLIVGTLTALETSALDGKVYATVEKSDGTGPGVIEAYRLNGPRVCRRPQPRGEWGDDQVTCRNCGRPIYANGPYDTDRLTHRLDRVPSRYR
jgi:hypothetical protein